MSKKCWCKMSKTNLELILKNVVSLVWQRKDVKHNYYATTSNKMNHSRILTIFELKNDPAFL